MYAQTGGMVDESGLERLEVFFDPSVILPAQFFTRANQYAGEVRMLVRMLKDAIECWTKKNNSRLSVEAHEWLFGEDYHAAYKFEDVCESLNLEPEWFRKALLAWRARGGTRIQRENPQYARTQIGTEMQAADRRKQRKRDYKAEAARRVARLQMATDLTFDAENSATGLETSAEAIIGD